MWLRQSTASQEIQLGRFVDSTDGDTEETGLTIANTDIKIWKAGATVQVNKNLGGATHDANGMYSAVLDATDSNTLGNIEINVHVAGALSVKREFIVVPANFSAASSAIFLLYARYIPVSGFKSYATAINVCVFPAPAQASTFTKDIILSRAAVTISCCSSVNAILFLFHLIYFVTLFCT